MRLNGKAKPAEYSAGRGWYFSLNGGDKRDRTADLLNAIQALSQLSYTPKYWKSTILFSFQIFAGRGIIVGQLALPAYMVNHPQKSKDF